MIILLKRAWNILWHNRLIFLALNILYYGIILALMIYTSFNAPLQNRMLERNQASFMTGALSMMHKTEVDGEVFTRLTFSFLSNLLSTSYAEISLPSFIIPFVGIFVGLYRAALLGVFFSPLNPAITPIILPHLPTLFLEGQAYILAMLGAFIHGRAIFWPASVGQKGRWKAFVEGVRQSGTIYMFIMPILFISSSYSLIELLLLIN